MPYTEAPNPQLCTYTAANTLATKLRNLGVPIGTITEITEGKRYDTTDPRWVDGGQTTQYVANIWNGPEQNLGITDNMFKTKGYNWGTFSQLGTASGLGTETDEAILELKNVYRGINAVLAKQME